MDQNFNTVKDERGPWVQVASGTKFFPLSPTEDMIQDTDIVSSLAKKCRFNGHCRDFVSVAEHSVMVHDILLNELGVTDPRILLQGLLHDAGEAYLCDVPKPIKSSLTGFQAIENGILDVVMAKFMVPTKNGVLDDRIHCADARGGIYEFSQNMDPVNAALLSFDLVPLAKTPFWALLQYSDPDEAEVTMWDLLNKLKAEVLRDL